MCSSDQESGQISLSGLIFKILSEYLQISGPYLDYDIVYLEKRSKFLLDILKTTVKPLLLAPLLVFILFDALPFITLMAEIYSRRHLQLNISLQSG